MSFLRHFSVVAALVVVAGVQHAAAQAPASNTFRVFVRGVDTGIEEVTVTESADGWTLRGSGKLRAPVNIAMDFWEARYDRAWKPLELTINLTESAKLWTVHTTFSGTIASSDIGQAGQIQRRSSTVAADTVVLPNLIFGAYEALAARLATEKVGSQLEVFIAPQDVLPATIHNVTDETIKVPGRTIAARRWTLHMGGSAQKLEMDVWTEGSRLLRLDIPTQMLTVMRDDIASVSARLVTLARPNDEEVSIPANGFSLAATISRPIAAATSEPAAPAGRKPAPARLPAVVLVSGSGPSDRDEFVAGIPIFAQLATAFADAGYLVVRYDERGAGQSGGRQESATIEEFAIDARAVVAYLLKRRDVDPKKISLIGYGEGGWISLLVAARDQKIAAVGLIATPSTGERTSCSNSSACSSSADPRAPRRSRRPSSSRRRFSKRSSAARVGRISMLTCARGSTLPCIEASCSSIRPRRLSRCGSRCSSCTRCSIRRCRPTMASSSRSSPVRVRARARPNSSS